MTEAAQGVKRIVLSGRTMQVCGMMIARSLLCPALLVATLLPACTREIYYREGASQAQITAAQDACVAQAYREAPVRTVTTVLPGTFIPERQVCDGAGNCQTIPARFGPPQIVSTCANWLARRPRNPSRTSRRRRRASCSRLSVCWPTTPRGSDKGAALDHSPGPDWPVILALSATHC